MVVEYNKYMLGVDKLDQMMSYYSFLHKSVKWWRKVFFWMLDMVVVNSYIIHKQTQNETKKYITHLEFRRELIQSLIEDIHAPRFSPASEASLERSSPTTHLLTKRSKRRDCHVCSDRSEKGERHLTLYVCATCTDNPPLCPNQCFSIYHTRRNYKTN